MSPTSNSTVTCFIATVISHYNITDLPDSVVTVWTVIAIVNGFAAPLTAIFNALIIWGILGDHQLRSKAYNILLASLAVTDLIVGLVAEPLFCLCLVVLIKGLGTPCLLFAVYVLTIAFCGGMALCTLMMTSVERYLAIQLPFFHHVQVRARRVMFIAIAIWVYLPSSMIGLRILLDNSQTLKKLPPLRFVLGNVLVTIYCTARVHITAYFKKKQPAAQETQKQQKHRIKDYKRAFALGVLVLTSTMLYFPFIIVNIVYMFKGKEATQEFELTAIHISITIVHLQSIFNPIIILKRIEKIRKVIKMKILSHFNEH
ncbi:G-protein coupled receptor 12-like [Exaiptasia diaphana]|uniref:G-protein coupled receptors family 1 profile domain-containing protein n=1 Tax=Exaiptasia diaphana TaxID=2652724 RepID=A0A913Y360_EXADI|nr:G-protein coupled receptor 12-like [Exaiptasia diaphana]